jgi:hypothetical protein
VGTKERDLAFWLFAAATAGSLAFRSVAFLAATFFFAALFLWHFAAERPRAMRRSREAGFGAAVFVPLWPGAARLRLFLARRRIAGRWERAWEVHVLGAGRELVPVLEEDLLRAAREMPGLYFWETSFPVPAAVRKLIREKERQGRAFWTKGRLPVPRAPFLRERMDPRRARHGAVLIE